MKKNTTYKMNKTIISFFALILLQIGVVQFAFAASCCGSNISAPMLITTGEKIKLQMNYSSSQKTFHALNKNQIILLDSPTTMSLFNLKAGFLFPNDFQVGGQISKNAEGDFADTLLSVGKELEPIDQIRNYLWTSLSLPTGRSIEQVSPDQNPSGAGLPILYLGAMFTEILPQGDLAISAQAGHGFAQTINSVNNEKLHMLPSQQYSLSFSGGLSEGPWRIGSTYQYQWISGRQIENQTQALASFQSTVSLQLSYMSGAQIWNFSLSDDSLIGPAQNAYLQRSVSFNYINRWFDY